MPLHPVGAACRAGGEILPARHAHLRDAQGLSPELGCEAINKVG